MSDTEDSVPVTRTLEEKLKDSAEAKQEGTEFFRAKRWEEALVAYRTALAILPPRIETKGKHKAVTRESDLPDDELNPAHTEDPPADDPLEDVPDAELPPLTGPEAECAKARAILNGNIGACYVKLDDHQKAIDSCTQALLDDPLYIKALQRRATSNEKINTWSSLTKAQEDYATLLELLPPSSPQIPEILRSVRLLKPRVEAAQKAETAEMLDKLKGLGNSFLGNFGLSTDNFKMEPNGQGGYSMNFVR